VGGWGWVWVGVWVGVGVCVCNEFVRPSDTRSEWAAHVRPVCACTCVSVGWWFGLLGLSVCLSEWAGGYEGGWV
jgi:hypothetical protein